MAKSKLNPRQEKFVREYVKTGNGRQSYLKAGYQSSVEELNGRAAPADCNAARLIRSEKVNQAIVAQQLRQRTRHDYSMDSMLADLEDDRQLARQLGQLGPAVQANTVKARMLGLIVDRKEVGAPGDFGALDTTQAVLALITKELGQSVAAALQAALTADTDPPTIDVTPEHQVDSSDGE